MSLNKQSTVAEIATMYDEFIPDHADQRFIFDQMLNSIACCEQFGSTAWSISILKNGFRLNVGPVEVMTVSIERSNAFVAEQRGNNPMIVMRLLLVGDSRLTKLGPPSDYAEIHSTPYTSVGVPNSCYLATFDISVDGVPDKARSVIAGHISRLRDRHHAFIKLSCHTSTGRLREKSNFARFHCPAIYDYARQIVAASSSGTGGVSKEPNRPTENLPSTTEAERLVLQRLGQEIFRRELLKYWNDCCCITGLNVPALLRASHSQPWAQCATDAERLDVYNGLLLAPHLDVLFDGGWITVENDGEVKLSDALSIDARTRLHLLDPMHVKGLHSKHHSYLAYHRDQVFLG